VDWEGWWIWMENKENDKRGFFTGSVEQALLRLQSG
jgi:hypothetical protein